MMWSTVIVCLFILSQDPCAMSDNSSDLRDCMTNEDCPNESVCLGVKCEDPCGSKICGANTNCYVRDHMVICTCQSGYIGNPTTGCFPLGLECTSHDDCASSKMCTNYTCVSPCETANCGENAHCHGYNHMPMCSCSLGHSFSPISGCMLNDPCSTANCGENSQCKESNHVAMCSCKPGHSGNPLTGCVVSEEKLGTKVFILHTDKELNWNDALTSCKNEGMNLATINNEEEQQKLIGLTQMHGDTWWWVGGSDFDTLGDYKWTSTNTSLTYKHWLSGDPNNVHVTTDEVEHCMRINGNSGDWIDYSCSVASYYICEGYIALRPVELPYNNMQYSE